MPGALLLLCPAAACQPCMHPGRPPKQACLSCLPAAEQTLDVVDGMHVPSLADESEDACCEEIERACPEDCMNIGHEVFQPRGLTHANLKPPA